MLFFEKISSDSQKSGENQIIDFREKTDEQFRFMKLRSGANSESNLDLESRSFRSCFSLGVFDFERNSNNYFDFKTPFEKIKNSKQERLEIFRNQKNRHSQKRGSKQFPDFLKRDIVLRAIQNGISKTSKEFGIYKQNIQRWMNNGTERKKGCGRKVCNAELENFVIEWIESRIKFSGKFSRMHTTKIRNYKLRSV